MMRLVLKIATLIALFVPVLFLLAALSDYVQQSIMFALVSALLAYLYSRVSILPDSAIGFAFTGSQWMRVFTKIMYRKHWDDHALDAAKVRAAWWLGGSATLMFLGAIVSYQQGTTSYNSKIVLVTAGWLAGILIGCCANLQKSKRANSKNHKEWK